MKLGRGMRVAAVVGVLMATAVPALAYSSNTWFDGAEGHANATRQWKTMNAPMLVYFRVDWCPHCRRFDELLGEPEMRSGLAGMIKVRLDPERSAEEKQLFEEYGGGGYPSIYLYPAGGGARREISHRKTAKEFLEQLPSS